MFKKTYFNEDKNGTARMMIIIMTDDDVLFVVDTLGFHPNGLHRAGLCQKNIL